MQNYWVWAQQAQLAVWKKPGLVNLLIYWESQKLLRYDLPVFMGNSTTRKEQKELLNAKLQPLNKIFKASEGGIKKQNPSPKLVKHPVWEQSWSEDDSWLQTQNTK